MKILILTLALISFSLWPLNYFSANKNLSLTPKTVFESDYQGRQLILRNINLYPTVFMARIFQNKAVLVSSKYFNNLFDFLDPNYYFFGSHPREVPEGQNYTRLPLLTLLPIFWFFFNTNAKRRRTTSSLFGLFVITFSLFTNHYVYDFLLWPLFLYVIYFGLSDFYNKKKSYGIIFTLFLLAEVGYEITRLKL